MWCDAVSCASEEIKKHGGKLEVKMEAKEVGQREDAELQVHTYTSTQQSFSDII